MPGQVDFIIRALNAVVSRKVKEITLDITDILVRTTPIDTGWSRSNWVPSIGGFQSQPFGSREAVDTGSRDLGITSVVSARDLSHVQVFISNFVPYIVSLNAGSSSQAPAMFVTAAIVQAVEKARITS